MKKGAILRCRVEGSVAGEHAGGIVGKTEGGKIEACRTSGSVAGRQAAGGIAGYCRSENKCYYAVAIIPRPRCIT